MTMLIAWSPPRAHLEDVFTGVHLPPAPQPAETFGCQVERPSAEENLEEADAAAAAAATIPFVRVFIKT